MAKKKPKIAPPKDSGETEGIDLVKSNLDTEEVHRVECGICGEKDEVDSMDANDAAAEFYSSGWRYETSKKFQLTGLMCPQCAKLPDDRRGED